MSVANYKTRNSQIFIKFRDTEVYLDRSPHFLSNTKINLSESLTLSKHFLHQMITRFINVFLYIYQPADPCLYQ